MHLRRPLFRANHADCSKIVDINLNRALTEANAKRFRGLTSQTAFQLPCRFHWEPQKVVLVTKTKNIHILSRMRAR